MKYLTTVLFVSSVAFFTACGGGGSSSTPEADTPLEVDNSQLADGENQYGYFGENVIFGDTNITRGWDIASHLVDGVLSLHSEFYADSEGYLKSTYNDSFFSKNVEPYDESFYKNFDYGVSQDGSVIRIGGDYNAIITFIRKIENCIPVAPSIPGGACYYINFKDSYGGEYNASMKPSEGLIY